MYYFELTREVLANTGYETGCWRGDDTGAPFVSEEGMKVLAKLFHMALVSKNSRGTLILLAKAIADSIGHCGP